VIEVRPKPHGHGAVYLLTDAGRDLSGVLSAMGDWGERWLELGDEHTNPALVLWAWCSVYLARERLPEHRVVVRFDFTDQRPEARRLWMLVEHGDAEACKHHPGSTRISSSRPTARPSPAGTSDISNGGMRSALDGSGSLAHARSPGRCPPGTCTDLQTAQSPPEPPQRDRLATAQLRERVVVAPVPRRRRRRDPISHDQPRFANESRSAARGVSTHRRRLPVTPRFPVARRAAPRAPGARRPCRRT
jgi:hypothetical protein